MTDMGAGLTPRERYVLRLVARGLTNEEIAERLGLRRVTVANYVRDIAVSLGLSSRKNDRSTLRYAVLALQHNELRELRAKLADAFEIEGRSE